MAKFVEFINAADEKLANELVSPNAIFHVPGRPEPMIGPAGYMAIVAMMRGGFSDIQWTLEETIAEEDKVAARFTMNGTHTGTFMGVPPTQKTISVQALNIYHLENGQIVKEYGQPDLLGLLIQLGAFPS
ncbi:ester cyclase [Mesorhizobium caraganae]|uniref:ester cyclase n=1 Tax=Mesorhizobium caraganae TaxID=483206 RepID=UPI00333C16E8